MLVQTKNMNFEQYIPHNSKIAITDICYEDVNYNINNATIRVACILTPAIYHEFFAKHPRRDQAIIVEGVTPYWHRMKITLTPGAYSNLDAFISGCKIQISREINYGDRTLLARLFSRFVMREGRLEFTPDIVPEANLQYVVKFGPEISSCLGVPNSDIFINSTGHYIPHSLLFKEAGLINFNVNPIVPITCDQIESTSGDKTLGYLHIENSQHKIVYSQIKELGHRNLISCNLKRLNFNWSERVKIIFMNIDLTSQ